MGLLRRLTGGGRLAAPPAAQHLDPELEARLPPYIGGLPLDRLSVGFDGLDEYGQYWFGVVLQELGRRQDEFTLAQAGRPGDTRAIRAARFRGARPQDLQRGLDIDAQLDRRRFGGDETVVLGGARVRRGVAGVQVTHVGDDAGAGAVPPDPSDVYHQLVRGDTWFDVFCHGDEAWSSEVVTALADGAAIPGGEVHVDLPEGWLGSTLPGGADRELTGRIRASLAGFDPEARARWDGVLASLEPDDFARPYVTGTRLVAFDLAPRTLERGPARLEVWEHLAPYESLDEELDAERRKAADSGARSLVGGIEPHPAGRAARVAFVIEDDDLRLLVDRWLLRVGRLAYQLQFVVTSPGADDRAAVDSIARSFVAEP